MVDVWWNKVTRTLNFRLMTAIQFYELCTGRVMGAASFESNLLQHLIAMIEEVLYDIFLKMNKSYYALYQGVRCMFPCTADPLKVLGKSLGCVKGRRILWGPV